MNDLIRCFEIADAEAVELALCEAEEVVINQEGDRPEDIVANFAELIPGLSGHRTQDDSFEIQFQDRKLKVELSKSASDEDDVRRAIRDVLSPELEIRVLRSCLGTDTVAFVIDTTIVWHRIEQQFSEVVAQLLTPFVDEIRFDSSS